jgi:hypothetical protein
VDLRFELLGLARQRLLTLFEALAAPLILSQRDDALQVGVAQPLHLAGQLLLPAAELLAASLELLREPVAALRPLQRLD